MSYTKTTDFSVKDALLSGNSLKVIRGTEIDVEFDAIETADALNMKSATLAATGGAALVGIEDSGGHYASTNVETALQEVQTKLSASSGASLVGYLPDGSGAVATTVEEKLHEFVSVQNFGAVGDGVTSDTTAFNDLGTWAAAQTLPLKVFIPGGKKYIIDSTVNWDLPNGSVVIADGAFFECTHNGLAFDLNPVATAAIPVLTTADTYTKRNITWRGGTFINTNATKTASIAFQAFFMRVVRFIDVRIGNAAANQGFYCSWKIGAKDTYRFIDCYSFDSTRHWWVPAAGVLFTSSLTGNDLIDIELRGCHVSCAGNEAGFYSENRIMQFRCSGGSFNGEATVAQVRLSDNSVAASRGVCISGTHFESCGANKPSVKFVASGSLGFYGVQFDGGFEINSSTALWDGIELERCNGVFFGAGEFIDGTTARAGSGVYVDSNSRDIRVTRACQFNNFNDALTITNCANNGAGLIRVESTGHGLETGMRGFIYNVTGTVEANGMWLVTVIDANNFDLQSSTFTNAYVSGGTFKLMNAIAVQAASVRPYIFLEPECVPLSTTRALTNYQAAAQSSGTTTINMSNQLPEFLTQAAPATLLWPRGYDVHLRANDSGSAASAVTTTYAWLRRPSASTQFAAVQAWLGGLPNDARVSASGHVPADNDGNIELVVTATGAGTNDVSIGVSGIRQ